MEPIFNNYSPTFLYVDRYRFPGEWVSDTARLPYNIIRYILSGSAIFMVDGREYKVSDDDVFYAPRGTHFYCAAREEIVFISIRFMDSFQLYGEDLLNRLWNVQCQCHFSPESEMRDMFEKIYASAVSRVTYRKLETRGYLNLICAALAKQFAGAEESEESVTAERNIMESIDTMKYLRTRESVSQKKSDPRIQALADYISLHPETNMSREEMCRLCSMSESTLRRLFKACTGKSIYEYTKDTKMLYASHLLIDTTVPVSEIAYKLGYESASYFTKTFGNVFGTSPQEYRKMVREGEMYYLTESD